MALSSATRRSRSRAASADTAGPVFNLEGPLSALVPSTRLPPGLGPQTKCHRGSFLLAQLIEQQETQNQLLAQQLALLQQQVKQRL